MSEGPLFFFFFTEDFQNVDRTRSETKELMSSNLITFFFELKGRCRTVRNSNHVELLA